MTALAEVLFRLAHPMSRNMMSRQPFRAIRARSARRQRSRFARIMAGLRSPRAQLSTKDVRAQSVGRQPPHHRPNTPARRAFAEQTVRRVAPGGRRHVDVSPAIPRTADKLTQEK